MGPAAEGRRSKRRRGHVISYWPKQNLESAREVHEKNKLLQSLGWATVAFRVFLRAGFFGV